MKTSSWVIALTFVAGTVAGCQLLLPDGEEDGTTTQNLGGASASSTRDASSSGKTTTSKSSASETTGTDASTGGMTTTGTDATSTSSGPDKCMPGGQCTSGFTSPLPSGCPSDWSCDQDQDCSEYCSAMDSLCHDAYASKATCCSACAFLKTAKLPAAQCCHVAALNALAANVGDADSCTLAGPFGSAAQMATGSACGTQTGAVCQFYQKGCSQLLLGCPTSACVDYFENEAPVHYKQNQDPTHKLSNAMDTILGNDPLKCDILANLFCPPTMTSSSSSSSGVSTSSTSVSTGSINPAGSTGAAINGSSGAGLDPSWGRAD